MRLPRFLTTPLPPAVLALADDQITLALLSRRRDALVRAEAVPVDPECFRQGPVGLLQVDRALLAAALGRLAQAAGKLPPRGTVLLPTAWTRSVQIDVGGLPRRRQEAEDVIRWRLKKLLPCRPEEVRLDYLPMRTEGHVLVVLALDRPLAVIEETLAAAGVRVGRIESTALAVANLAPPAGGPYLVVVAEPRSLGFAGVENGAVTLLRQKALPADAALAAGFVAREVEHSLTLLQGDGGSSRGVEMWVVAFDGEMAAEVEAAVADRPQLAVRRLVVGAERVPAQTALPGALLGALLACGSGREE
ncbi:MAG TPA: hypothetical protein P5234_07550 [Thermoanaerobaculaceae bacterium]|nr:hypothetical protein [Thermoanaerobaculaceae bacterium]HRS16093.1 hypothetical protein [Thermoanaerobaculaceae bacterium]